MELTTNVLIYLWILKVLCKKRLQQTKQTMNSTQHNQTTKAYRETPSGIYTLIKGRQTVSHKHRLPAAKPFNLERNEFVAWHSKQPKFCRYCDIPEEYIWLLKEKYGDITERLTIDCKEDSIGYRIDNLVLCCAKCNLVKQNILTFDEMMYIGQNFIKPKWLALVNGSKKE